MTTRPNTLLWLKWFVRPHAHVAAPDTRRQIELFLFILLILIALSASGTLYALFSQDRHADLADAATMGSVCVSLLICYLLGRSPRYLWGIGLSSIVLTTMPFIGLIADAYNLPPELRSGRFFLSSISWLAPALIFSAIFLPLRHLLSLIIAVILLAVSTGWYISDGQLIIAFPLLAFTTAVAALAIISRLQYRHLEQIRAAELIQARDVLEQRVRERTAVLQEINAELDAARQAAENAYRDRARFLADISHDLRTPLTIILGFSEMLHSQAQSLENPDFARRTQHIEAAARYLADLSKDMLDLSRLELGEMEIFPEWLSLSDLLDQIILIARPLIEKNRNAFFAELAEDLGVMYTDATRLKQILLNLLSNAAKFTEEGSVTLRVRRERSEESVEQIVFEVMDTGIGITAHQLKTIFQPYPPSYRESRNRYSGAGMGLAITYLLCRKLGGSIDVHSIVNEGSTFTVRLPARYVYSEATDSDRV
ncbi:MAG: HAMP domain-containing sensor histidine kinase [Anaerolineales bacterium]|nr:HAMP domain-containing sensor histidine kinase [Anaerolineales bacterium]